MFALINTKMTDSNVDPLCYMKLDNEEMTGFGKGSKSIYITLSVLGILVNIGFLFSSVFKQKKKTYLLLNLRYIFNIIGSILLINGLLTISYSPTNSV